MLGRIPDGVVDNNTPPESKLMQGAQPVDPRLAAGLPLAFGIVGEMKEGYYGDNIMEINPESSMGNIVPTVFTWIHGGTTVFLTGAWDRWQSKAPMHRTGNEYSVILSLPAGHFQYKFIVDGEWRHSPSLPVERDEHGNMNNMIEVKPHISEFDRPDPLPGIQRPTSPFESYDFSMPAPEEYAIDPPQLPPHYHNCVLSQGNSESGQHHMHKNHHSTAVVSSPASGVDMAYMTRGEAPNSSARSDAPLHVCIKHLYTATKNPSEGDDINVLGFTKRYKSKMVTTVIYMPSARIEQ